MAIASKQKRVPRSINHKRRNGLHQKRNDHFMKTYWPYLPLMMVVVVGLAVNSFWSARSKPGVLAYATEMSVSELFSDTNAQRASNGESALNLNSQLDAAAQAKANDMVAQDYWSHDTPEGTPPWVFITNAGYQYSTAGENLAYGFDNSDDTVTGWMNSAEHRANILNSAFVDVGFGFANSANFVGSGPETVVVAEYAAPAAAPAPAPAVSTPAPKAVAPTPVTTTPPPATTPAPAPTTTTTPAPTTTKTTATTAKANTVVAQPASQKVARIQIVTDGSAPWSLFVASTLISAGVLIFFLKHGLSWRRAFVYGENFVVRHRLLDLLLVIIITAGYILTRTAGVIR
jgi:cysteine-rich secretory family protein